VSNGVDLNIQLPVRFFRAGDTKIQLGSVVDIQGEAAEEELEEHWRAFRRASGKKDVLDVTRTGLVGGESIEVLCPFACY